MTAVARELYRSPNGDSWHLASDEAGEHAFILHEPNAAFGGRSSRREIGEFLRSGGNGPEHQALLRLIGSLARIPDEDG